MRLDSDVVLMASLVSILPANIQHYLINVVHAVLRN